MNQKQEQIKQYLEQTFEALAQISPNLANTEIRQRANEKFLNAESDIKIVKQKIDKAREKLIENYQEQIIHALYKKIKEQTFEKDNKESKYLEDFKKIQILMNKTMNTYCTEFLEKKGLKNPLSEGIIKIQEQLNNCSSDQEYAKIVNTYLNSFQEGHLYLKEENNRFDNKKPDEITPLFVKRKDGKFIVSATSDAYLQGKEITAVNGIPIEHYLINKGFQRSVEMQIINQDGQPFDPEFHINDNNCAITLSDGLTVQIDNISYEQARDKAQTMKSSKQPNIICGYTKDGIPYVRISSLDSKTKDQSKKQLEEFAKKLNEQGQTDLVIDIRGNKGGSDEYIEYLGAFSDGDYCAEHEYEQLVGISEKETNENLDSKKIEDIDIALKRITSTSNRKKDRHTSIIPNGNSSIINRLLLVDGQVFSSADKMAKTAQDSGFATVVGSEMTAGDGRGFSIYQVDTPILRQQGMSITMPSSMGTDYSDFQTMPDIIASEHEINTNLKQIMEQSKSLKIAATLYNQQQMPTNSYSSMSSGGRRR